MDTTQTPTKGPPDLPDAVPSTVNILVRSGDGEIVAVPLSWLAAQVAMDEAYNAMVRDRNHKKQKGK